MGESGRSPHETSPAGANSSGAQTEPDAPTREAADKITPQSHFRPAAQVRMLFDAAKKGELQLLKRLIDHGVNVNATDKDGFTPLHIATDNGRVKCMEALIGKKANHLSDLMNLLRESGGPALSVFLGGRNPKDLISLIGNVGSFCSLVSKWYVPKLYEDWGSADVNKRLKETGETPLHIATRSGNVDCLTILVATGGDVNKQLKTTGETPLHIAASNGNHNCLQILSGYIYTRL